VTVLRLIDVTVAGSPAVNVDVAAGEWASVAHADPQALLAAVAGDTGAVDVRSGRVLLAGEDLTGQPVYQRVRAGLAICGSAVPDVPGMRVLDVALLARTDALTGGSWRAVLGSRRAREATARREAAVRALADRMGIGRWVDADAVGLPPRVAAVVDLVRALAAGPRALVWAVPIGDADPHTVPRPDEPAVPAVADALAREQERLGLAVLAVEPAASR
jgi:ABC-type branched-subunit amino acid transport system ATPase component